MPRKSRALRTSQAKELVEAYRAAGMSNAGTCRFATDMVYRLERGKGISAGQRRWLDDLIESGVPEPKNPELVAVLESAAKVVGMESKVDVLTDFAYRARMGWDFSAKQGEFMDSLLEKAEKLRVNGPFAPTEEQIRLLRLCKKLSRSRSAMYWNSHPGESRALNAVSEWLVWSDRDYSADCCHTRPVFDNWHVEKILKTFRSKLEQLNSPKFVLGNMHWLLDYKSDEFHPAVVVSGPHVEESGKIVYEALVNGEVIFTDRMVKTRRR